MKLRRSLLAFAALLLPALACQLIVGIDDHEFRTPDGAAVVDAAPPDATEAASATCVFGVMPPKLPIVGDGPDLPPIVFAIHHGSLRGRNADGGTVGFDLDGVCTCDPRDKSVYKGGASCVAPAAGIRKGSCDEDGGVDDAIAYAFDSFGAIPGFATSDQAIDTQIACGRQTLIYVLQNYNGLANDPDIVVTAVESIGIHTPHDGGVERDASACKITDDSIDAGDPYPALFDGTDVWSSTDGVPGSIVTGWVRDFRLVLDGRPSGGSREGSVLPLLFGSRAITIGTPIFVARLVPLDGAGNVLGIDDAGVIEAPGGKASSFRLEEGIVSGRASVADVLAATGAIRVGGSGSDSELCAQPTYYCPLKTVLCNALDTVKLPSHDFRGDSCDALSMVLQFDAVTAVLGATRATSPQSDAGCGATWADKCDGGVSICP